MMVSTMRFTPPTSPTPTMPVLIPMPARNSSEPSALRSRLCSRKERSMASPARTASGSDSKTATISSPRTSWIMPLQLMIGSSTARRKPMARLLASDDVHVLEHGRVAPDVTDEHGHLAFDPIAAADPAKVVDVEDAQQFVGHEPRLHVHQGLSVFVGGP